MPLWTPGLLAGEPCTSTAITSGFMWALRVQAQVLTLIPQIFHSLRSFSRLPEAKHFLKVVFILVYCVCVCLNACLCTTCIRSLQKSAEASDPLEPKVEMVDGSELSSGPGN